RHQQLAQVAPQQVPVKVVRLPAFVALDDQAPDADRAQQCLVDLQICEVLQYVLPVRLGERVGQGLIGHPVQLRGGIGRVALEWVERLLVHLSHGSPLSRFSPSPCPTSPYSHRPGRAGSTRGHPGEYAARPCHWVGTMTAPPPRTTGPSHRAPQPPDAHTDRGLSWIYRSL